MLLGARCCLNRVVVEVGEWMKGGQRRWYLKLYFSFWAERHGCLLTSVRANK